MKKIYMFFLCVCLICFTITITAFCEDNDINDNFESDIVISTTDGWTLKTAEGVAGTIVVDDYILDATKNALTFTTSGNANSTLAAERVFSARTEPFVVDFETAFKSKGNVNLLYAYQGSTLLFAITTDANKIGVWMGTGAYDNTAEFKTLLSSYDINTAYHFQIAVNPDEQIFTVYLNGEAVLTEAYLRNRITTGMNRVSLFQASNSTAIWQLLNFGIQTPTGSPLVSNVTIDKTPYLGNTITADYTFAGNEEDDFSTVKWMYSDSENGTYKYITGATEKSFTVTPYVAGKWIKAEVTPCNGVFALGTPLCSEPVRDMTDISIAIDENVEYSTKNNAVWDSHSGILTLTTENSTGAEAKVTPVQNITGTLVLEASIKNKNKDAANALYVYQDNSYVFNIAFNSSHIVLSTGTEPGYGYTTQNLVANYTADTWYDIRAIINTDSNTADFYVNEKLVFEGLYLRCSLTKGITQILSFRGTTPVGETYVKDLKLYGFFTPELTATSARIDDIIIYKGFSNGTGCARLDADLLDQFGNKMNDTGFKWELSAEVEGVSLTPSGILMIEHATTQTIEIMAISNDDTDIVAYSKLYSFGDFYDSFESDIVTSTNDGWVLKNADGTAGTIVVDDYVLDETKKALTFTSSNIENSVLSAERAFPARTGTFIIDFETAFKNKGNVNLLYAYQDSTLLFAITTDANKIGVWTGTGAYDNTAEYKTLLSSYDINTAYHFQIAVNSDEQIFNVYLNGVAVLAEAPLRNKITTGMNSVTLFQTSNSTANWQLLNFNINAYSVNPSVSNVIIDKTPYFGRTIVAEYTYDGEAEDDFSTVKWMYSDSENGEYKYIPDGTEKSFTVTPYVAGKWIKAEVTPCNGLYAAGTPVYSAPVLDATVKTVGIDENTVYNTKNNANSVWDKESETLTLKPTGTTAAVATVGANNVTETVVFEASIKNKTKSTSNLIYVYKDSGYVFNITFDANNINLLYSSTPGQNVYKSKSIVSSYAADTWYDVKAIINTTTNTADFYVNDVLTVENAGLRADLSSKGITSMSLTGTTDSGGETCIKGLKLYSVSAPTSIATSAKIQESAILYSTSGLRYMNLEADLLNQFGEKIDDNGFSWELVTQIDGVSLSNDGRLIIYSDEIETVTVKAVSKDDEDIIATKVVSIREHYVIKDFTISASDGKPIVTLDRSITVNAKADAQCNFGSNDITIIIAFYDAYGRMLHVSMESKKLEYGVFDTVMANLYVEYNDETAGGRFKAFILDNIDSLVPLTKSLSTKLDE